MHLSKIVYITSYWANQYWNPWYCSGLLELEYKENLQNRNSDTSATNSCDCTEHHKNWESNKPNNFPSFCWEQSFMLAKSLGASLFLDTECHRGTACLTITRLIISKCLRVLVPEVYRLTLQLLFLTDILFFKHVRLNCSHHTCYHEKRGKQ